MPKIFISAEMPQTPMPAASELFCKDENGVRLLLPGDESSGKIKRLKFARDTQPGVLIEQFENFCLITSFDASARINGLEISDYEGLKATLAFGLRAGAAGLSAAEAFRIFMFYLLEHSRVKDARRLLKICARTLQIAPQTAAAKEPIDLLAIALNAEFCEAELAYCQLLSELAREEFSEAKTALLVEFARFFKPHKKIHDGKSLKKFLKR